jgi:hypothetical protein
VELALAMPVLLILLSGLLEFGFALNQYLNALDAAREGARYAADGDPTSRDTVVNGSGITVVTDTVSLSVSKDYYLLASTVAQNTMAPVPLNPATDDIVISVFRVLSGHVFGRWPDCGTGVQPDPSKLACPNDPPFLAHPSTWPETMGEWHQWGRGDQCTNKLDDNGDGNKDEGCTAGTGGLGSAESSCDPKTDYTCNPSHFTSDQIQALLDPNAPNTAVVLVEVFYNYNQLLKVPWITAFVPDPQRLHSYTIIPVPAAEPSLTISGTVRNKSDNSGKPDVTINFSNGIVAVTEPDGTYIARGFDSTPITVTASFPGCIPNPLLTSTNQPQWNITPFADVSGVDFVADCPPPTSTPSPTVTPSVTSAVASNTPSQTTTPTQTQTPTITPTRTSTAPCTSGQFDASQSHVSLQTPANGIVQSDGSSTATLVVTLLDNCSNPLPGQLVSMSSSRGSGTDIVSPASAGSDTTNINGQSFFTVKSSVMSPWDSIASAWTPSVMSAQVGATTLSDTRNVTFVCVRGEGLPTGGNNEVFWQYTNSTGLTRRLVRVDVTWPQAPGRLLQLLDFNGTTVWNLGANFSPVTINSNFVGSPTARNINDTNAKTLLVTFNFLVTGAQEYTTKAFWDDGNGGSVCDSGSVTVVRGSVTTAVPSSTATTPANTPTRTATSPASTPTPTATAPASTATPTVATNTPTLTPTATVTPVPPSPTASPTNTTVPTATPTGTPTPTPTTAPTPSELFFSEYVEGSSTNQALEIYNGTGATVNLATGIYTIEIRRQANLVVGQTIVLTGTVLSGHVYVVVRSNATAALLAIPHDQTAPPTWFNGDDNLTLKHNGTVIDVFGQVGFDPGAGYGVAPNTTNNHTLRRKIAIIAGDTNGADVFTPAVEWDFFPSNDYSGLGTR